MDRPPQSPVRATDVEVAYRSLEAAYQQLQTLHSRLRFTHSRLASPWMRSAGPVVTEPPRLLAQLETAAHAYCEAVKHYEDHACRSGAEAPAYPAGARS